MSWFLAIGLFWRDFEIFETLSHLTRPHRPSDIDSGLYNESRPLKEVSGLARLLLLEHRRNTATPAPHRPQQRKLEMKPDGFNDERILEGKVGGVPAKPEESDYILVFVPYGPRWYLHRIVSLLTLRFSLFFSAGPLFLSLSFFPELSSGTRPSTLQGNKHTQMRIVTWYSLEWTAFLVVRRLGASLLSSFSSFLFFFCVLILSFSL